MSELLSVFTNMFSHLTALVENYGWHLLIIGVIFAYIYNAKLKSYWSKWKKERDEAEYAAKYHKNPDLLSARMQAQQSAVERLQEKYKIDAEEFLRKQQEKEYKKREEIVSKLEGKGGVRLGNKADKDSSKTSKTDYFPLMGPGSSSSYRPPKKSKCGGGGCGR